jgi:hypothetical protein
MTRSLHDVPRASARGGWTVVELAIALVLLATIAVKATLVLTTANETQGQDSAQMSLEDQARRVLDRIAYAIMGADRETLFPEPVSPIPSTMLRYQVSLGFEDGDVIRPYLDGEVFNGSDDNANGVIDEKGLAFVIDRDAVTIRLSLERIGPAGEPITQTVQTTVTVRN